MKNDHQVAQLYQLSVALGTTLDLAHEAAAFMAWLTGAAEPVLAALFITDEAKQELRLVGAHGFTPPAKPRLAMGLDLWRWLAEQGAAVPEEGDPRRYAVPIPIEQQLFGTLCLVSHRPADELTGEQQLVQTAAGYLAPVLRNIHRYQTLEQRVAERTVALSALNAISAAISRSLDLEETLAAALDATLEVTGFAAGGIALWNEKEQRLECLLGRGVEPEVAAAFLGSPRAGGHREHLLHNGQPVFHDDTAHDPTVNPEIARLGFTLSAMVPLVHAGKVLGILAVATRAPRRWTEEDKTLLTAVGQQIAVAVANAQLYEEMQRSEEKYRSLVNTTNDLIFTVDVEGNILFANPAAKAFTGDEPEEAIGHHFSEYVHPEDVPILLAGIQQVLSGEPLESVRGVGQPIEYRMRRRSGQIVWVQTRAWPIRDAQGKIAGFGGITRDITERKQAEEALSESEERFRRLAENAQDLIYRYEFTPQRGFTYVSPAATAITGYTPEDHYADPDLGLKIVHPDDRPLLEQYFQSGGVFRQPIVLRWVKKDGTLIWTEQRNVPIYDEAGNLVALEGIARDVTERKQAEETLRAREAELAAVFESTPLFLALLDEERRVTKINRAGADFSGRPADEVLGLLQGEALRCLHVLDDPRGCGYGPYCEQCAVRRTVLDTLHSGRSHFQVEADYPVRRDGRLETLHLLVSTARVSTPAGPRVLVSMEDITIRHHTLEALRAIYDLGQKLVLSLQVEEIAQLVTDAARQVLRFPRCELWLADEQTRAVVPISQTPAEPALTLPSLPLDEERGIIPAVVRSGQTIYLPDVHQDPRYVRDADYPSRCELCVPLRVRERTIGALNAESEQADAFAPAERELLEALANAAAVAIENARLYQESQRRAAEMAALRQVNLATLSTLEREQVFEIMLDQLGKVIEHDTAAIKVITPEGRDRMIAGRGPVVYDQAMWNGFDVRDNQLVQEMRETGQPVVVHDTRTDERYEKVGDWEAFPSWAGAPLFVRGDLIGYLAVEKASPGFYDEHAAQLLGDFARAAAIALENARLYEDVQRELAERKRAEEALRRRLDELTVLQAIAAAGTEAADEDTLIARATQIIGDVFHPDNFGVVLLDEASGLLRPHPSHRLREEGVRALSLRLGEGIVGQVALTGRPRRVPDVRLDPDYVEGDPQTRSELCVPMQAGERVIGVINSESTALDAYSEDDERLLSTVAGQLATAIEKIRLFKQTEQRALEMTSLYTTSLRLATAGELNELLQTVIRQAMTLLEAAGGCLYLYDQAADELELMVVQGIVREEDLGSRLQPGEGLAGKVMQERQPMVVDDYRTWEGRSPKYEGRPYTATAAVPLLWQDQLLGVLDVLDNREQRTFDEDDVRLLTLLAQQAAAAIANARLLQAEQKRAGQLAAINELGRALAATLDLPTICRTAYEHVQRLVDCHYFGISLFDPQRQVITAAFALEEGRELDPSQFPPLPYDPQARAGRSKALASGQPELVPDLLRAVRQSTHEVYRFGEGPEALSALYVPMIVEEQVIGLLEVQSYRPDAYRQEDVELLSPVANHIGLAIQNARLFDETRRLKEFNESIVQNMAEGIFVEDVDGVCTFANPAAAKLLGYAPQELLGQHWTAVVPPAQQPIVRTADERRRRGGSDRYELELVRKDGTRISVLVSGSPRFQDGRFVGTMAVFTDISERKRAEAQLAEQLDELRRWHAVTLGREMRVLELKREVNALLRRLNEPIRYPSAEEESSQV